MIRNIKIIAIQMKNINVRIKENLFKKKRKILIPLRVQRFVFSNIGRCI